MQTQLEARNKHLARQAMSDALRAVRTDGEAWVTFQGSRLHLTRVEEAIGDPSTWNGWEVICRTHHGLRIGMIVSRKQTAERPYLVDLGCFLDWKHVYARVAECYPKRTT